MPSASTSAIRTGTSRRSSRGMRPAAAEVPARAALAGNPSDGYGGRTLAVTLPAFAARAEVEPAARNDVEEPLPAAALRRVRHGPGNGPGPARQECSTPIPAQG